MNKSINFFKKKHINPQTWIYFEIYLKFKSLWNIRNVFPIPFDLFEASLLNTNINILKKKKSNTWPANMSYSSQYFTSDCFFSGGS